MQSECFRRAIILQQKEALYFLPIYCLLYSPLIEIFHTVLHTEYGLKKYLIELVTVLLISSFASCLTSFILLNDCTKTQSDHVYLEPCFSPPTATAFPPCSAESYKFLWDAAGTARAGGGWVAGFWESPPHPRFTLSLSAWQWPHPEQQVKDDLLAFFSHWASGLRFRNLVFKAWKQLTIRIKSSHLGQSH